MPALVRWQTRDGHITAKADEDTATVDRDACRFGSEIGGERFRGGTQVDLDAGGDLDNSRCRRIRDPAPAGDRVDRQGNRCAIGGERTEVDRIAGVANRASNRGVDSAVGELGCTQRGGDRLTEHRRDRRLVAATACEQHAELAVIAEPAARAVDRVDDALHRRGCALQVLGIGDDHLHEGSERRSPVRGDGHEAPLTALADDELPLLAEPVASGAAVLLDAGVVVIDVVDVALRVPAYVCAESAARATTATVAPTPDDTVSFFRNLSARSRSATVILFTHLRMSTSPGARVKDSWANPGKRRPGAPCPACRVGSAACAPLPGDPSSRCSRS